MSDSTFQEIWDGLITKPYKDMLPGQWFMIFKMHLVPPLKFKKGSLKKWKDRYHRSEAWKLLTRLTLKKHKVCQECKKWEPRVVDHLDYDDIGMEHPDSIQALCLGCHQWVTRQRGQLEKRDQIKILDQQ